MDEVSAFIWSRLRNELAVLQQSSAVVALLFMNPLSSRPARPERAAGSGPVGGLRGHKLLCLSVGQVFVMARASLSFWSFFFFFFQSCSIPAVGTVERL